MSRAPSTLALFHKFLLLLAITGKRRSFQSTLLGMIEFFFAGLPIAVLVVLMTKPNPLPAPLAFFLAALCAFLVRSIYFHAEVSLLSAAIVAGLLEALTPISIVFGAIFFFVALEKSGAMNVLQAWLRGISSNRVAQLMLVGWAFVFLIEGACGFGTPAALAAPILVALGFPAVPVLLLCLIFNAIPTVFGAVGTPIWFGFELLQLKPPELIEIGGRTALLQSIVALIIPVISLRLIVDWATIRRNLIFIYLSVFSCVGPMLAVAFINYEFPAVVGGVVGLITTILLARFEIGLERPEIRTCARSTPLASSSPGTDTISSYSRDPAGDADPESRPAKSAHFSGTEPWGFAGRLWRGDGQPVARFSVSRHPWARAQLVACISLYSLAHPILPDSSTGFCFVSFTGWNDFLGDARDGGTHRQARGRTLWRLGLREPSDGWW